MSKRTVTIVETVTYRVDVDDSVDATDEELEEKALEVFLESDHIDQYLHCVSERGVSAEPKTLRCSTCGDTMNFHPETDSWECREDSHNYQ